MSLFIVATGHYCERVDAELTPLKVLLKETLGVNVRRIDRFIQLALIGAGRASKSMPSEGGVYLASGRGDMEITVELLDAIYREGSSPKPLSFINSVSNAAGFYVAKCLGINGPSSFVTSRYFAIESALAAAAMDLERAKVSSALVGAVDIVLPPLEQHRERLLLPPDADVAEASYWFQLRSSSDARVLDGLEVDGLEVDSLKVLAELTLIRTFSSASALQQWLAQTELPDNTQLAFSQFVDEEAQSDCLHYCNLPRFDESSVQGDAARGHFDSRSSATLAAFISHGAGALLLISGDRRGRYRVMIFLK